MFYFVLLLVQDRMTCYQSQNNDSISTSSLSFSSSSFSISPNNESPDLESKYTNLKITLNELRTKVENITHKANEDSNEISKFDSFAFIKEFWNKCIIISKEIFAITFDFLLDKTIELFIKVLINPESYYQLRECSNMNLHPTPGIRRLVHVENLNMCRLFP